jgi:hypothetical protein
VYQFFSPNVTIQYDNGCLYHWFPCVARVCKTGTGGIRRYQDKSDKASTANLRHHASRCWGEDVVHNATTSSAAEVKPNQSIFAAFTRRGQQPITISHCQHTKHEVWLVYKHYPLL